MSRFIAWFRFEWRDHWKLVAGCVLALPFLFWIAILIGGTSMLRPELEASLLGLWSLTSLAFAAPLFSRERRSGAESFVLRTPGSRVPLFAARLAFYVSALGIVILTSSSAAARIAAATHPAYRGVPDPALPVFLMPRWILGDLFILSLAVGCVALLLSSWTRRVTVALVLGVVLPGVLLFPWIYLGAARQDFFPFLRYGAIPLAAWPLLALALVALGLSWFHGRRHLNRPWRALRIGVLVLLLGLGTAGAWTAHAFAEFDRVDARAAGFRVDVWPLDQLWRPGDFPPYGRVRAVALSPDGTKLWVQGYRCDAGQWPFPGEGAYGEWVSGGEDPQRESGPRDFREDRGTWSSTWMIDLETGDARAYGDARERLAWSDLGTGVMHGALRGVDLRALLDPRGFALLGRPGRAEYARVVDLETGDVMGRSAMVFGGEPDVLARKVARSGTSVRDMQGRPAWLEAQRGDQETGGAEARTRLFVARDGGRTEVTDERVLRTTSLHLTSWLPVPGGWGRTGGDERGRWTSVSTSGATFVSTIEQYQTIARSRAIALQRPFPGFELWSSVHEVVVPVARSETDNGPWRWRVVSLADGAVRDARDGPAWRNIVPMATPEGSFVALETHDGAQRPVLWDPATGVTEVLSMEGSIAPASFSAWIFDPYMDSRGNLVFAFTFQPRGELWAPTPQLLYFHAKTRSVHRLAELPPNRDYSRHKRIEFEPIGIDARDRLVGLRLRDNGYRQVVRYDPKDKSHTVLFPKAERGPLK